MDWLSTRSVALQPARRAADYPHPIIACCMYDGPQKNNIAGIKRFREFRDLTFLTSDGIWQTKLQQLLW